MRQLKKAGRDRHHHSRALRRRSMGQGGITGCRDDSQRPRVVPAAVKIFLVHGYVIGPSQNSARARLTLSHRSPWGEGPGHVTESNGNSRRARRLADVRRRAVCLRPRSRPWASATPGDPAAPGVNRTAKADREAGPSRGDHRHPDDLDPRRQGAGYLRAGAGAAQPPGAQHAAGVAVPALEARARTTVACEPSVSVLTEIAKQPAARPLHHLIVEAEDA